MGNSTAKAPRGPSYFASTGSGNFIKICVLLRSCPLSPAGRQLSIGRFSRRRRFLIIFLSFHVGNRCYDFCAENLKLFQHVKRDAMRACFLLKVRPEKIEEYKARHAQVWPEMLAALREVRLAKLLPLSAS